MMKKKRFVYRLPSTAIAEVFPFGGPRKSEDILEKGFTLIEMLVVISILAVVGVMILTIFTRTLKGSNKSQIIGVIKQNGQSILENLDKTIRNADRVVCPTDSDNTIVVVKNGLYTRYRFTPVTTVNNGLIEQEVFNLPSSPPPNSNQNLYIRDFEITLCTDPMQNPQIITDTNTATGISVTPTKDSNNNDLPIFNRNKQPGFKDEVTIQFVLKPGINASSSVAGQIDPVSFQTTIQLR